MSLVRVVAGIMLGPSLLGRVWLAPAVEGSAPALLGSAVLGVALLGALAVALSARA